MGILGKPPNPPQLTTFFLLWTGFIIYWQHFFGLWIALTSNWHRTDRFFDYEQLWISLFLENNFFWLWTALIFFIYWNRFSDYEQLWIFLFIKHRFDHHHQLKSAFDLHHQLLFYQQLKSAFDLHHQLLYQQQLKSAFASSFSFKNDCS